MVDELPLVVSGLDAQCIAPVALIRPKTAGQRHGVASD